jgi:hypothetical protein
MDDVGDITFKRSTTVAATKPWQRLAPVKKNIIESDDEDDGT